jgi:hypothetical protein
MGDCLYASPRGTTNCSTVIYQVGKTGQTPDCPPDTITAPNWCPFVVTNWWVVSSPGFSGSGAGAWVCIAPTNCGSGTVTLYATYRNVDPCTGARIGGGTISVTNNFTVVNVQIAEAWKAVRVNGTTSFTLTNTCGAVTWSVSPQQPGGPYANGSTIVAGTNCGSWTVTATSTLDTNCTASSTLYVVNLTAITDASGNPISSAYSNNVVIVGQPINLLAQTCGGTFSNFLWGVDPSTFSDYSPNSQTGMVVTYFPLTNSSVSFYWKDAGSKQVSVSAVCSNITFSTNVTMSVLRPTAHITATTGTVGVNTWDNLELSFGTPSKVGITNPFTLSMPSGYYNYGNTNYATEWIQVIASTLHRQQTNDGSWYRKQASGVLDTEYPYPLDWDAPGIDLLPTVLTVSASDSFDTTLMFQPNGGQWVPLRHVTWNWTGIATNGVPGWGLQTGTNAVNPPDADTTTHPSWVGNWTNYSYRKEQ